MTKTAGLQKMVYEITLCLLFAHTVCQFVFSRNSVSRAMEFDSSESDRSESFLRSKEELELELKKAKLEAQVAELKLESLELDRQLRQRRKNKTRKLDDQVSPALDKSIAEPRNCNQTNRTETVKSELLSTMESTTSTSQFTQGVALELDAVAEFPPMECHQRPTKSNRGPNQAAATIGIRKPKSNLALQENAKVDRIAVCGGPSVARSAGPYMETEVRRCKEQSEDARIKSRFSCIPSWLISAIGHTIVLLMFALLVMPLPLKSNDISIVGQIDTNPNEEFEEVVFEVKPLREIKELEIELDEFEDMRLIEPGELAGFSNAAEGSNVSLAANISSALEIGSWLEADRFDLGEVGSGQEGVQFFGAKARGNSFAFVVDRSASMGRNEKWKAALQELMTVVTRMEPKQLFFVIFFAGDPYPMFNQENPECHPVRATKSNIEKLEGWLQKVEMAPPRLPSNVDVALRQVLEMRPDAVFLLTDGEVSQKTERFLSKFNAMSDDPILGPTRPTTVHTIGFSKQGEELLKKIAQNNGGTYTFHELPKAPGRPRRRL